MVKQRPSRHRGLDVTVVTLKRGPRFRAYVHTPGCERLAAVSTAGSADAAVARAEAALTHAIGNGVRVNLPAQRRPQQSSEAAA